MMTKNTGAVASMGGFVPEVTADELVDHNIVVSEEELEELFAEMAVLNKCPGSH